MSFVIITKQIDGVGFLALKSLNYTVCVQHEVIVFDYGDEGS